MALEVIEILALTLGASVFLDVWTFFWGGLVKSLFCVWMVGFLLHQHVADDMLQEDHALPSSDLLQIVQR